MGRGVLVSAVAGWLIAFGCAGSSASALFEGDEGRDSGDFRLDFNRIGGPDGNASAAGFEGVGDLDGDGDEEIAAALTPQFSPESRSQVVVKLGNTSSSQLDDDATAMRILLSDQNELTQMTGLGDLNGDGIGEVAVSTGFGADVAVVFGRLDGGVVDLDDLGDAGFKLTGADLIPAQFNNGFIASSSLASPGDLDGDGRDDLALAADGRIAVFFPPDHAAGKTFDVSAPGPDLAWIPLQRNGQSFHAGFSTPGDLDGDGHPDLTIFWNRESGGSNITAVMAARPGTNLDLDRIADTNAGYELSTPTHQSGGQLGDVNGDGRADVLMYSGDGAFVAFSPARGTERTFGTLKPGEAKLLPKDSAGGDGGDIDGDGRDDIVNGYSIVETGGADMNDPSARDWDGDLVRTHDLGLTITDQLEDSNGDGLPELLTAYRDPSVLTNVTRWTAQTYLSRRYIPISTGPPLIYMSSGTFNGAVDPTPANLSRLGGNINVWVEIHKDGHLIAWVGGSGFNQATGRIENLTVPLGIPPIFTIPDGSDFRLSLERDGVSLARSGWLPLGNISNPGDGKGEHRKIKGTTRDDRLVGTPQTDWIRGKRGDDVLVGRASDDAMRGDEGSDVLKGSSGDDVLVGGKGRDTIDCGPGDDTVVDVERRDRVRRCETRVKANPRETPFRRGGSAG